MLYADRLRTDEWAIFLFHGVTEQAHDFGVRNYTRKHIPTSDFAAIMRSLLAAGGKPVSMGDGADDNRERVWGRGGRFSVTFDDGFANVMDAVPILRELRIPATFYIATDWVGRNQMSWIDRVEWAVENDKERRLSNAYEKQRVLEITRDKVKGNRVIDTNAVATEAQADRGCPETWSLDDAISKKLTWGQVRELAADPLFTIGGHTHTHATLPFLSETRSRNEIEFCLSHLENKAGVKTEHFSYPEGQEWSYSERTIEQLKAAGIKVCPTAIDGTNPPGTNPFLLKRIMVT